MGALEIFKITCLVSPMEWGEQWANTHLCFELFCGVAEDLWAGPSVKSETPWNRGLGNRVAWPSTLCARPPSWAKAPARGLQLDALYSDLDARAHRWTREHQRCRRTTSTREPNAHTQPGAYGTARARPSPHRVHPAGAAVRTGLAPRPARACAPPRPQPGHEAPPTSCAGRCAARSPAPFLASLSEGASPRAPANGVAASCPAPARGVGISGSSCRPFSGHTPCGAAVGLFLSRCGG